MAEIRNETLTGEVSLDGNTYVDCEFKDARLTYEGGLPPAFNNCVFNNSQFAFDGAAGRTIGFLRAMAPARTNMRHIVVGLLPELGLTN